MLATRRSGGQKQKRRYSEKRKEKSRVAARCRRGKESEIFLELSDELPFPCNIRNQMDKASIIRLALTSIKVQHFKKRMNFVPNCLSLMDEVMDNLVLKALEGFLLILSGDGDMMYLSESVNRYLGLQQIDLVGHSIYDFSHPCDHDEIKDMLSVRAGSSTNSSPSRSFFIRMKCTLTDKGKNVNMKSGAYKVIHYTGQMMQKNKEQNDENNSSLVPAGGDCLISIGEPIPHPSDIQVPLDKQTFLSRHNLDMTFTYVDERISELLGYSSDDLLGKSIYQFHHAQDGPAVEKSYKMSYMVTLFSSSKIFQALCLSLVLVRDYCSKNLQFYCGLASVPSRNLHLVFAKGQCETGCYRFLAKHGGYVWVLTQATVIYGNKAQKPHCVVCINYIVSGLENVNEVVSEEQVKNKKVVDVLPPSPPYNNNNNVDDDTIEVSSAPLPCTNTIFAPRTKDMSKGFLMFLDDDSGFTVLKDEPEDLTHLAPTAGDVCIPLDVPSFSNDMFEDVLFSDSFCDSGLIADFPDEIVPCQTNLPLTNDPLLSYRADKLSPADCDDQSQSTLQRSSSSSDLHSTSSDSPISDNDRSNENQNSSDQLRFLGFKLESANILSDKSSDVDLEVDEFELRAPYIPMGIGDDLPLLTPPDHLWMQISDTSPPKLKSTTLLEMEMTRPNEDSLLTDKSSLAQLLQSTSPLKTGNELAVKLQTNVQAKTPTVRERLREACSRSESEKNALYQKDIRVRSEFDGGGGGGRNVGMKTQLNSISQQVYQQNINNSTKPSTRNKFGDLPTSTASQFHFEQNHIDDGGTALSKSSSAQKRNREFLGNNGKKCIAKRPKLDAQTIDLINEEKSGNRSTAYNPESSKQNIAKDSVLMNLLVSGEDPSHGYSCYSTKDVSKKDPVTNEAKLHSKNFYESDFTASLLNPEGSTIPSLLDVTQWDTEVNAPIYTSQHLLQGQELLNALDASVGADDSLI